MFLYFSICCFTFMMKETLEKCYKDPVADVIPEITNYTQTRDNVIAVNLVPYDNNEIHELYNI